MRQDRKTRRRPRIQQLLRSPDRSPPGARASSASDSDTDMGDDDEDAYTDDVSVEIHACSLSYATSDDSLGTNRLHSPQPSTTASPDSQNSLPRPINAIEPFPMSMGTTMQPQPWLSNPPAQPIGFTTQYFTQAQFASPSVPMPVSSWQQQDAKPRAVYMRRHPLSSFASGTNLWIGMIGSDSVQELRQAATSKFPETVCGRIEGVLRDGQGDELALQVDTDQELSACLTRPLLMQRSRTVELLLTRTSMSTT